MEKTAETITAAGRLASRKVLREIPFASVTLKVDIKKPIPNSKAIIPVLNSKGTVSDTTWGVAVCLEVKK